MTWRGFEALGANVPDVGPSYVASEPWGRSTSYNLEILEQTNLDIS
jgi:hypothetical protein